MGTTLAKGDLFPASITSEIFNKVRGKSSIAKLSGRAPIPFNGVKEFTFSMDSEIDVVAENGAKSNGGATVTPVTIVPIKVEYGARVSDEFMNASEEEALPILQAWIDGFSAKLAKGADLMMMHGINPRAGSASTVVGNNNFDSAITGSGIITYTAATPDANIDAALAYIEEQGYEANGIVLAPTMRSAIASLSANGQMKYPEFAWGATPDRLGGMVLDSNVTVSFGSNLARAYVGDFQNAFKWGISKELPIKVIEYGCPDNNTTLGDLQGHNQVYLRSEAYIGWGILDAKAFAMVKASNG